MTNQEFWDAIDKHEQTEAKFQIGDKVEVEASGKGTIVERYKGQASDFYQVRFESRVVNDVPTVEIEWFPVAKLTKLLVVTLLLAIAGSAASTKEIKSTYVSDHAVLVACKDGKQPMGNYVSGALLVSCR